MKKKILLMLISAVFMASSVVGCGDSTDMGGQTSEVQEQSDAGEVKESTTETESPADKGELETVKILALNKGYTGANGRQITLKDWYTEGNSQRWNKLTDDLAEKGVKLELDLIEADQYQTNIQTMVASGEISKYDWVCISPLDIKTRLNLVKSGQIQSVSDIWNEYSEGSSRDFFETEGGKYLFDHIKLDDGKAYWLSDFGTMTYEGKQGAGFGLGFQIRQDWLDAVEREVPKTLDDLYDTLIDFRKKDVNQNGEEDEVIRIAFQRFDTDIAQWFGLGTGITFINSQDDNKVTSPWYQENVQDYIQFMQKLYADGLLVMEDSQTADYMMENRVAGVSTWGTEMWLEPSITIPEGAEYPWYAPFRLEAIEDQAPLFRRQNEYNPGNGAWVVPANSTKQEAIAKIIDWLVSDEGILLTENGIEGVSYEVVDGQKNNIFDSTLENPDAVGAALWTSSIFPWFELNKDISGEMKNTIAFAEENGVKNNKEAKFNYTLSMVEDADHMVFHDMTALAVPTIEEADRIAEIESDLNTYSEELLTKLITGKSSLDDWDMYISDLQELGLDELIEINQARYDRAFNN